MKPSEKAYEKMPEVELEVDDDDDDDDDAEMESMDAKEVMDTKE